ncbi:16760_t:CDS:2, partial [Acaulospora colombiana]
MSQIPTIEEIKQAAEIIKDYVHKTPVITSSTLDSFATNTLGRETRLVFKCENFQKVGAFKIRGATHAVRRLLETVIDPSMLTVVTHSSGNHAQALALAARQLGVQCQVVMPSNAPLVKKEASTVQEIIQRLEKEAAQAGKQSIVRLVPPYDHLDIVRGQGTISLELLNQAEELNRPLDIVIAPVGGGGMLSGVSLAAKNLSKDILVFGAEPT